MDVVLWRPCVIKWSNRKLTLLELTWLDVKTHSLLHKCFEEDQ